MPGRLRRRRIRPPYPIPPPPAPITNPDSIKLHSWFQRYGTTATDYIAKLAEHPNATPHGKFKDSLDELTGAGL